MKTSIMMGVSAVAMMAIVSTSLCDQIAAETKNETVIVIVRRPTTPPETPRTPEYNPFFAELMNDYVILGAPSAIGTVSVSLTSTAGDNYSTCFDTSDGAILLPVSGNAGYYTLTIITADGTHYVGEFTI